MGGVPDGISRGQVGSLIVVNVLIFGLAFFLTFRAVLHRRALVGTGGRKLGMDLIWFGVPLGVNMQTSFMHPPLALRCSTRCSVPPPREHN